MNVVNIITGSDNGGGGEYVLNICRSNLFNSSLICIGNGALYDKAKEQNINVSMFSFSDIVTNGLIDYISNNNIDIIIWHGAKAFFLHSIIKKKIKIKSIATVHSDFNTDFLNNRIKKIVFTKLSYFGLKSFENYIAVSTEISKLIKENFKYKNLFIVRNAIDSNLNDSNLSISREEFGIDESDFVFTNIARLHPVKNHIKLLKGFILLKEKYDNCRIMLIGGGAEEGKIKSFIDENRLNTSVIMLGEKKNAFRYIKIGDANILASINEGGEPPIVILEGAIMNKPTLCSDINNLEEIVTKERGYVFNPNDEQSIFKAMEKCIMDNNREEKAKNFKKYVEDNYSLIRFYSEYKDIFEKIALKG